MEMEWTGKGKGKGKGKREKGKGKREKGKGKESKDYRGIEVLHSSEASFRPFPLERTPLETKYSSSGCVMNP